MKAPLALVLLSSLALACPAFAQDEAALKAFFEGKRVTLKIDMPGSQEGIDVHADASRALDSLEYGNRLKAYGPAIRSGDRAVVTLVKVKKDLIEFQLSGGGFGTFGDDTSTSVYIPYVEKSGREIELEKRVRDEDDRGRRRDLQRELDRLRDDRERQNRHIEIERAHLEEIKRARVAMERQQGGSRFNVRYEGAVPRGIRPEEVMAALGAYVDFSPLGGAPPPETGAAYDPSALQKGHDALRGRARVRPRAAVVGAPRGRRVRRHGSLRPRRPAHHRGVRRRRPRPLRDYIQIGSGLTAQGSRPEGGIVFRL